MLNEEEASLGSEHFWQDCSMHMEITSGMDIQNIEVLNNAVEVVKVILGTKLEHNLYFNPNLTDQGVRGKVSKHGVVLVLVCGTLHKQDKCVGVFEQLFGLIRDPGACNNWKIKNTQLHLKSELMISHVPRLEEGTLLHSIESA